MAANYIEIDTAVLRSDTESIREQVNAASSQLQGLFEDVQTLNTMWEGPANDAFNTQFTQDYETMEEILKEAQLYATSLDQASEEYEKCEDSVDAAVRAMNI